ncbi:pyrroline-5-carboxylate reductase [Methylocapsa palsarum]|uniref:Pyrroline-5-carboxylate reductase n=1 Tax=Methylocapsa palsarum TaxID=1612308 RepID=A0A1I3Z2K3_9HYPH|nr:pyrroline-5-carboxylate reductase [Methylocapsa palsarum]SFK38274.1 pyrroline-5-carboxylate reductase [Methylocapsa palsarum]
MAGRFPASLVLAGAGKMGGALLRAWLEKGLEPSRIRVLDPHPSREILDLAASAGFSFAAPDEPPEVLVLAMKPQVLDEAAALAPLAGGNTLVISILAGKTIGDIAARLPSAPAIVRAMPNLPAAIGRGATGAAASEAVTPEGRAMAETLLGAAGHFEWLADESLINAVTAISGSGPAYVFYLTECLSEAGLALGLPADVAARLARASVEGAGELLFRSPLTAPAELRRSVTSPGGTTAAALDVLMAQDGLAPLLERTVRAAKRRAEALSG